MTRRTPESGIPPPDDPHPTHWRPPHVPPCPPLGFPQAFPQGRAKATAKAAAKATAIAHHSLTVATIKRGALCSEATYLAALVYSAHGVEGYLAVLAIGFCLVREVVLHEAAPAAGMI